MKRTLILLTGLLVGAGVAQAEVVADFSGSTADTTEKLFSATANGLTTAANLNAGSAGATWSNPSSSGSLNHGVLVSSGTQNGMTGNWLMIGRLGNDTASLSVAEMTLGTAVTRDGTSGLSLDLNLLGAGGQDGGLLITGFSAGGRASGSALFQAIIGFGGVWGQRDLMAATTLDTPTTIVDNNLWGIVNEQSVNIAFNLGAAGYTMTGADVGATAFNIAGGYLAGASGDLATVEFRALGSKAGAGIDNITVIPEPATIGLVAAFGGALLIIRRKLMI